MQHLTQYPLHPPSPPGPLPKQISQPEYLHHHPPLITRTSLGSGVSQQQQYQQQHQQQLQQAGAVGVGQQHLQVMQVYVKQQQQQQQQQQRGSMTSAATCISSSSSNTTNNNTIMSSSSMTASSSTTAQQQQLSLRPIQPKPCQEDVLASRILTTASSVKEEGAAGGLQPLYQKRENVAGYHQHHQMPLIRLTPSGEIHPSTTTTG